MTKDDMDRAIRETWLPQHRRNVVMPSDRKGFIVGMRAAASLDEGSDTSSIYAEDLRSSIRATADELEKQ